MGKREDSLESYRRSARSFFEQADYEHSLILLELVMNSWNPEDDLMYDESIRQRPEHFPPEKTVEFALQRNKWNEIRINDLKERKLAPLFLPHRMNPELKAIVSTCSEKDRSELEHSLPLVVADYYFDSKDYFNSATLYLYQSNLSDEDLAIAESATSMLIQSPDTNDRSSSLDAVAQCWIKYRGKKASETVSGDVQILLQLYENPLNVARPRDAFQSFGSGIIRSAFMFSKGPKEELHSFSRDHFEAEVEQALKIKFGDNLLEAVQWYIHKDDKSHADKFASQNMSNWSDKELLTIARSKLNPRGLIAEADKKDILVSILSLCSRYCNTNY